MSLRLAVRPALWQRNHASSPGSHQQPAQPRFSFIQTPDAPAPPNVAALVRHGVGFASQRLRSGLRLCVPRSRAAESSPVASSQPKSPCRRTRTTVPPTATRRPALLGLGVGAGMGMGMIPTHTRCRCPRLGVSVAPSLARSLGLAIRMSTPSGPSARALAPVLDTPQPRGPYPALERRSESTCHAPDAHSNMRSFGSGIRIQ
jgi:hypothetical protein